MIGRLALCSIGAATVVLGFTALAVLALSSHPVIALMAALVGVIAAVAAMGVVANRVVTKAVQHELAERERAARER